MTYAVNKTDGTVLARINDGAINTTTTDLALFGKNFAGYGEFLNENFVKLLESFASTRQPAKPLTGQLWFDKGSNTLKLYSGTSFKPIANITVSATQPADLAQGDQWFDSANNQLYVYSGTSFRLIGPALSSGTAQSGFQVTTIKDNINIDKTIVKMNVSGVTVAIISNEEFTPALSISGFPIVYKGYTLNENISDIGFYGRASESTTLVDADTDLPLASTAFMRADKDTTTTGNVTVVGNLTLGSAKLNILNDSNDIIFRNVETNKDIALRINYGGVSTDAITIKGVSKRIGIFNTSPSYTLDVVGDGYISGNLNVNNSLTITTSPLYTDNSTKVATTAFVKNVLTNSPALSGAPTAPTATAGTNSTVIATTAFVTTAVSNLVDSAPALLDTLNELAAAMNDDPSYITNLEGRVTDLENDYAPLASPAFTGSPTSVTPPLGTDNTTIPTTEWVNNELDYYVPRVGGTTKGMTGSLYGYVGNATVPGYSFSTFTGTGMWCPANNNIAFSVNAAEALRIDSNSYTLVGFGSSPGSYKLQVNGQIYATNGTIATSDARLKQEISTLGDVLDIVDQLTPREFTYKQDTDLNLPSNRQVGFIAQEVEQVLQNQEWADSIVHTGDDSQQTMALAEVKFVPLLVKAIQELNQEVKNLKRELANLKRA